MKGILRATWLWLLVKDRWATVLMLVFFTMLVLGGVTTSSIGTLQLTQDPAHPTTEQWGQPQSIRSDEYNVGTPIALSIMSTGGVPTLSPLGRFVTQVVRPRLAVAPKLVAGPPKRFAQGVGATFTVAAFAFGLAGVDWLVTALLAVLVAFATLESVFAFCMGCTVFAWLMRAGAIPESVCLDCADITRRVGTSTSLG